MTAVLLRRRKLGKGSTQGILSAMKQAATVVRNWRDHYPAGTRWVFRWGCTSSLSPTHLHPSCEVVNTADSIHWCSDKRQGRLDMQDAGVSVPPTCRPEDVEEQMLVYEGEDNMFVVTRVQDGRAMVARPPQHAQGRNLFVGDILECADWCSDHGGGYISDLIDKVAEYRVFVCQNRAAWVAQKTPGNPEQVAWNVAQGGRFDNVRWSQWPMQVVKEALKAAKVSKTDFCGVDVMVDANGVPYVLEVNSAPSQSSPYRQQCVAKCFDFIIQNGKRHFPDPITESWKDAIHPALRDE